MGRRSNSGYIGRDFELDTKGVVDLNKRNLIRFLNDELTYPDPVYYFTGDTLPFTSLHPLGISNFGSGSAVATSLVSGTLANVTVYTAGTGYATNATLSFSGGGGTGANAYVSTFSAGALSVVERLGYIKDIVITDPGLGYTSAPTMSVSAPVTANSVAGVTAIISASITNGELTGYTIHNTGSNYRAGSNWPTITFSGGGATRAATAVPVLEFGRNYTSNPTITVTGAGSGAVVSASIAGVLSPAGTVTTAGGGYSSAPTLDIPAGTYSVSASATLSAGALSTVTIQTGSTTIIHDAPDVNVGGELSYPALNNNEIYGTYAVYNNNSNWLAFTVTTNGGGGYTVDWGDGTTNSYNSNVTSSKQYTTSSYAALSSSLYNGAKLTQVKITLSGSATSLATVNLTTRPTPTTGSFNASAVLSNQWLSIAAAGTNITSFTVGGSTNGTAISSMLERFYFSGSNQITSFNSMFINCYSLTEVTELFTGAASGTTAFQNMFNACRNLTKIPVINLNNTSALLDSMFINCNKLNSITFSNSSNVTSLNTTFNTCYNLQTINGLNFASPLITNYSNTFVNCVSLLSLPPINVTNVTTFLTTFSGCSSLTSIKFIGNTSKVTTFNGTFQNCVNLVDAPKELDCRSATGTALFQTFLSCRQLRETPVLFNSGNVTSASTMFSGCTQLKKVHLFDTSGCTTFSSMFNGCTVLTSIPKFNTRNATTMTSMFNGCSNLKTIPLLNTANNLDFSSMFLGCTVLVTIPPLNTAKATTVTTMFSTCTALTKIPYLDTGNVTNFTSMFASCANLTEVPTLNTSNATTMLTMFNACTSLKRVPNFNIPNCTSLNSMFVSCASLTEAPTFYNSNKVTDCTGMYNSCLNLRRVPGMSGASLTTISNMFASCTSLIEVGSIPCSAAGLVNVLTTFSTVSLKRMRITNINASFTLTNCSLDSNALNEIYTNVSATGAGKTITVTGNWGTANDNPSIATAKGWTVSG